jgi:hypothetical protein
MRIRPLVCYVSCTLASFVLTTGAVARAFTFSVSAFANDASDSSSTCYDGYCQFVTGSAFPTTSVQEVIVDYNNGNSVTQVLQVQLCSQTPTTNTLSCSSTVNGSSATGAQELTISSSQDGGTSILDTWTNNDANYSTLLVDSGSATFIGYKINGN